jgi:hypothetical protein
MLHRIKTINSHSGLARWLSEIDETGTWLARVQIEEIPSPYSYSPTTPVYDWNGQKVVWFETRHKHYEIFALPAELLRFKTEDAAIDWHIRFSKNRNNEAQLT